MSESVRVEKIALVGNPNSGKSSVFNQLTGLNQQIGNYPGITVDKKTGNLSLEDGRKISVLDLPGTYSIYARSDDEKVVQELFAAPDHPNFPDVVVVVADATNLERNLLLFSQVYDLKIPVILVLNMIDLSAKKGLSVDLVRLRTLLGDIPIIQVNARKGEGIKQLIQELSRVKAVDAKRDFLSISPDEAKPEEVLATTLGGSNSSIPPLDRNLSQTGNGFSLLLDEEAQVTDTENRYQKIREILPHVLKRSPSVDADQSFTRRLDRWFVHPIAGYAIFLGILFVMFQAVYSVAEVPMNLIDTVFSSLSGWVQQVLPAGVLTDLIAEGLIPGLGGVVIFIPQIVLLFTFIVILEETGYMARVVFITDKLMRPFGLSGKSVVPLISSVACAIPAIMASRNIDHWKDRLITIMVTPLMSCSARLPVYTLLISLVIPDTTLLGIFNLKGLVLLGLYLLGLFAALAAAVVFRWIIRSSKKSFLVLELPSYKMPRWKNVGLILWEKTRLFIWEAGKVIMAISVILWVLASYGPPQRIENAVAAIPVPEQSNTEAMAAYKVEVGTVKLENSFMGILGKSIEPAIAPLGYDWKIGIALITSFAAREVFVGSMATIYSVGVDFEEDSEPLIQRMKKEVRSGSGRLVYDLPTGLSLMVFYAFAMQCMSTLAITYRETKSWKWPFIQTVYMTLLAYVAALGVFNLFS